MKFGLNVQKTLE